VRSGPLGIIVASWTLAAVLAASPSLAQSATTPDDRKLQSDVEHKLAGLDKDAAQVKVAVSDGVVTLSGMVPTLWVKDEAIKRARKADRVKTLVSDLTIARGEDDKTLAREVGERIRKYDRYTVYDSIDGRVNNGTVTLTGAVSQPEKSSDILERIAKVRGVQAIDNKIEVLPANQSDDRLRRLIVEAIYREPAFENYSRVDPPIHVIVNNGHVTLIGYVRGQEELIKAESATRSILGVLALDNKVQVANAQNPTR